MSAVLLSMGSQRVRHNWATEQQQSADKICEEEKILPKNSRIFLPLLKYSKTYKFSAIYFYIGHLYNQINSKENMSMIGILLVPHRHAHPNIWNS